MIHSIVFIAALQQKIPYCNGTITIPSLDSRGVLVVERVKVRARTVEVTASFHGYPPVNGSARIRFNFDDDSAEVAIAGKTAATVTFSKGNLPNGMHHLKVGIPGYFYTSAICVRSPGNRDYTAPSYGQGP